MQRHRISSLAVLLYFVLQLFGSTLCLFAEGADSKEVAFTTLDGHQDPVASIAFSPDGKSLATRSYDNSIRVWDVDQSQTRWVFENIDTDGRSNRVVFSDDGKWLAAPVPREGILIWELSSSAINQKVGTQGKDVFALAMSQKKNRLTWGDFDNTVNLADFPGNGRVSNRIQASSPMNVLASACFDDGVSMVAVASDRNELGVWDLSSGKPAWIVEDERSSCVMAINGGRKLLATGTDGFQLTDIRLRSIANGALVKILRGHSERITALSLSFDGGTMLSGSMDQTVRFWDLDRLTQVGGISDVGRITGAALSPDGKRFAFASDDPVVKLLETREVIGKSAEIDNLLTIRPANELKREFYGLSGEVTGIRFSPDGESMTSLHELNGPGRLITWKMDDGKELKSLRTGTHPLISPEIQFNGELFAASADSEGLLQVLYLETCQAIQSHLLKEKTIKAVALTPDIDRVIAGDSNGTIHVWNLSTQKVREIDGAHKGSLETLVIAPETGRLVTAGYDGIIKVWDLESFELKFQLEQPARQMGVSSIAITENEKYLAAADTSDETALWDLETQQLLKRFRGPRTQISGVAVNQKRSLVATASRDGTTRLWNIETGEPVAVLSGHSGPVTAVQFTPDGESLATGGQDGVIREWDVSKLLVSRKLTDQFVSQPIQKFDEAIELYGAAGPVEDAKFDASSQFVATGNWDGSVIFWDLATSKKLWEIKLFRNPVEGLCLLPDGQTLVAASKNRLIKVPNQSDQKKIFEIHLDERFSGGLECSPDGTLLSVGLRNHTIDVWDLKNSVRKWNLKGHSTYLVADCNKFAHHGRWMMTCDQDGTVKQWDLKTGKENWTYQTGGIIWGLEINQNDSQIAVLPDGGQVLILDSRDGSKILKREFKSPDIDAIHWFNNGDMIVGGSDQTRAILENPSRGALEILKGHASEIRKGVFSPDGKRFLTIDSHGVCKVWPVKQGE